MNIRILPLPGIAALALLMGQAIAAPGHGHDGHGAHEHRMFTAGEPGDLKEPVARTVDITMQETDDARMLFRPDVIEVKRGEQVKFVLRNDGAADHEFMLDSAENNARHKMAMETDAFMGHGDPNGRRLAPKDSSEIVWRFTKPGTFEFACLIPGHYEAGMHGMVVVK